jgi:serralysin
VKTFIFLASRVAALTFSISIFKFMQLSNPNLNPKPMRIKNFFILALFSTSMFLSCSNDEGNVAPNDDLSAIQICTEMPSPDGSSGRTDGAVIKANKWTRGQTIRIKFLGGSAFVQGKVKQFAAYWLSHANVKFQYVSASQSADIKIAFTSGGSWSYIGTDCKLIGQSSASMNYGWFTNSTSDTEFRRVIVHEFGHALGMIHEHQHPLASIPWDKPKVYAYYGGPPNNWSKAQVDSNLFARYSQSSTNFSGYDRLSIMHYSIPASLTTNGFSVGSNTDLSSTDKSFIRSIYPF